MPFFRMIAIVTTSLKAETLAYYLARANVETIASLVASVGYLGQKS